MDESSLGRCLRNGADFLNFRDVVLEQVLDPVLERRRRAWAAGAGAVQFKKDDAVLITLKNDVAAILGDGRANPGL